MKLRSLTINHWISSVKRELHSAQSQISSQDTSQLILSNEEFFSKLLNRRWALSTPETKIHQIFVSDVQVKQKGGHHANFSFFNDLELCLEDEMMRKNRQQPSFSVIRDDLLHPLVNGNKTRKLDALLPLIQDHSVTDVVTCGGCQSAHAAAVAVSCAERGIRSHLLLRGEQPEISTGYNLISTLFGNVNYVPRSLYAKRGEMLAKHADLVAGSGGSVVCLSEFLEASFIDHTAEKPTSLQLGAYGNPKGTRKVIIIREGAGDAVALLGVVRLVHYLSQKHVLGKDQPLKIVVDAGTGTTAIGLGLGAVLLGLPWEVNAIMLADTLEGYRKQEQWLVSEFCRLCQFPFINEVSSRVSGGIVHWMDRAYPRKFGNVLPGEVEACQQIAQQTGVLLDPMYTLAAWELAIQLSQEQAGGAKVVMLHTGGTLGMFGIAQRYKPYFHILKKGLNNQNS